MASRLTAFLEGAFGKYSRVKTHLVWIVCALLGITLASELGKAQSGSSQPPVISTSAQWTLDAPVLASSSASGTPSNGFSMQGSFSPDGTHLLFWSRSTNIAPGATLGFSELYLKDLTTGAVSVVSADPNGVEGNSDSTNPNNSSQILMFSPDGTKVVFESAATNLVSAGANGHQQIFIKDLTTGAVTLVSVDANGIQGNANSMDFTFSPDGTKVAFDSASTNLIPGGTTGNHVFVKDLNTGAVTLASTDSNGVAGNGASSFPVFSPDGSQVAFVSASTNLAAGATNTHSQVYVKNLQSGVVTVASADANGNEANNDSLYPTFSPDGSKLAFNSISTNLVAGVPSNSEVYVKDLALGAITLVSADANGAPANGNSSQLAAFSPDSTKIAFQSASTNLVSGANGANQVFVKDLLTGTVTLVSSNAAGAIGNSNSSMPTFSPNHLAVAFQSGSTNFGATNIASLIFVRSIFTASGAVADNTFSTGLSTAGQLAFSDSDVNDTHSASVAVQAGDLGTVTATVSKDSTGNGTGGVVVWNYQVSESQLHALTAPATDNFTLTLTDSQGCTATTAIVVTALPQDFAVTNATSGSTPPSSTSTSSCPTLTVTSSPSNLTVTSNQTASFSAAATGSPAPTVQWQVSSDGGATFTDVPGATSSTLTFTATMSQNGNLYRAVFTNSSGSVTSSAATLTVNTAAATTTVSSSKNPTVFGQAVSFTATVSATSGTPTGTVTFLDGATTLGTATLDSTGAGSFTTSSLAVGNHSITASYSGDSNFNASTSSAFTQIVNLDVPTVAVNVSPNPSVFGQPLVATATVSATAPGAGTPTGTVTFLDGLTSLGTANLVNGQASFTISAALTSGLHSIMATYAGDGSFSQNSGTTGITVNKAATTASLTSSASLSNLNQAVTFTATVSAVAPGAGTPTGAVTFSDGSSNLGTAALDSTGTAAFTTSTLAAGAHAIAASYAGDSNFNPSSSTLSQIVGKLATTVTLVSSANPSVFGQGVIFAITVSAASGTGTPTGTVTLQDASSTMTTLNLVNGQASFTTASLAIGSHSITASYGGDGNFNSSSSTMSQTVNKASTATSLSSSENPSTISQSVTFTATVNVVAPGAGTPTGTVTFNDGSNALATVPLNSSGTASLSTSSLTLKSHSITAVYSGDASFNASTGSMMQNVQFGICAEYDQTRSVQGGATFPIQIQLCDADGDNLSSQSIVLHATAILAASGVAGPVQDSGNANPDNDFRSVGGSGQNAGYIFNLSTKGLATGTYALQFTVSGDPVLHTVMFGVQ